MTYSQCIEDLGTLSHAQTLSVLKEHDLVDTVYLQSGAVWTENFFDVHGHKEAYGADEVLTWLGY